MIKEFLQRLVFHSFSNWKQLKKFIFAIINDGIKCFMTHVFTMVDYRRNIRFLQGLDVGDVRTNN